jgi:RsmE family RNA methyltransferase
VDRRLGAAVVHASPVNLILFDASEIGQPLPRSDARARHLLTVLRREPGQTFDAGVVNGPRGKGRIVAIGADVLNLDFSWGATPAPLPPIVVLVGLPRPQTARDILRDAATLGVSALHFVAAERGERSYGQSTLWSSGEWRRHVRQGAEQAFCTRIPEVTHGRGLAEALTSLPAGGSRLLLDNYEAAAPLGGVKLAPPVTLAVGSERGWTGAERDAFRREGFQLVHLGARVLRTETACVAALTLVRSGLGLM